MADPTPTSRDTRTMPAGDARNDQVRANADVLAQQAEALAAKQNIAAVDPSAMRVEPEAAHILIERQGLTIRAMQRGFVYKWVYYYNRHNQVDASDAQMLEGLTAVVGDQKHPVWERVMKSHPEAAGMRLDAFSHVWNGIDCILFRCKAEYAAAIDAQEQETRDRAIGRRFNNLADYAQGKFGGRMGVETFADSPQNWAKLRREAAREVATKGPLTQMLRDGTVPGIPPVQPGLVRTV